MMHKKIVAIMHIPLNKSPLNKHTNSEISRRAYKSVDWMKKGFSKAHSTFAIPYSYLAVNVKIYFYRFLRWYKPHNNMS